MCRITLGVSFIVVHIRVHVVLISLSPVPSTAATSWSGSKWLASWSWGSPCDSWFPNIVFQAFIQFNPRSRNLFIHKVHQNKRFDKSHSSPNRAENAEQTWKDRKGLWEIRTRGSFLESPVNILAREAIFRSSVCKNGEGYSPETSCMKWASLHIRKTGIKQLCFGFTGQHLNPVRLPQANPVSFRLLSHSDTILHSVLYQLSYTDILKSFHLPLDATKSFKPHLLLLSDEPTTLVTF